LAETNPAFLPDLASALNNLGIRYSNIGQRQEAVGPTEEAVRLYRQLAETNPAFLPDLASALNNLGIRYSEIGQRQEVNLAWDETLGRFADQPAAFAFLIVRRALDRPPNELPAACADLYRCLSLNDLPMSSVVQVRIACRELRQPNVLDFDAVWRDLAGELPEWLLVDPTVYQCVQEWLNTPTWQASFNHLREYADTLLSDAAQLVFDELELATPDDPAISQHRSLLSGAHQHGIDAAYRLLLLGEMVDAWINTDTWSASRAFLDEHQAELVGDEALAILADRAADGQDEAIVHHALLTLVRLGQADLAYDVMTAPTQCQAELATARSDADPTRLIAYATIGAASASSDEDFAQCLFHLALGQALSDDPVIDQERIVHAKKLVPDQVPVWLGYISSLLNTRPACREALIALTQALLTQP
jgi:tetratricopeptide (TPR) repeat protein